MPTEEDAGDRLWCEFSMALPSGFGAMGQEVDHRAEWDECALPDVTSIVTPMPGTRSVIHLDVEGVSEICIPRHFL